MDNKSIMTLDGSFDEREKIMKDFFGLTQEQSFQDITVNDSENSIE